MKKLLVLFTLLFVSLNFVACAQKKDSKTRLTKGSGRESAISQTGAGNGWNMLSQYAIQTELRSSNPDAAARAFINNDQVFVGPSQFNSVAMNLSFYQNGQLNVNSTMLGLRFYDSSDPLSYFLGASVNRRAISGSINGNNVKVVFEDRDESGNSLGQVIVDGQINGSMFHGSVLHDGGSLGEFSVPVSGAFTN